MLCVAYDEKRPGWLSYPPSLSCRWLFGTLFNYIHAPCQAGWWMSVHLCWIYYKRIFLQGDERKLIRIHLCWILYLCIYLPAEGWMYVVCRSVKPLFWRQPRAHIHGMHTRACRMIPKISIKNWRCTYVYVVHVRCLYLTTYRENGGVSSEIWQLFAHVTWYDMN